MARKLENWIDGFLEFTEGLPSPEPFRLWSAYTAIAGALERRVFTRAAGTQLFPNCFILLVGPPGSGKTFAIREVADLWLATPGLKVAPTTLTKAGFIDELGETVTTGEFIYSNLLIPSSEFGTLMPSHDLEFLSNLNEIYDAGVRYKERTRYKGLIIIEQPCITLLAGVQPKYLGHMLPEAAYGQGFTSRIVMVYAAERAKMPLFDQPGETKIKPVKLQKALLSDMKEIAKVRGEFKWTDDAKKAVEAWNLTYHDDAPEHPKLQSYVERRIIHGVKLAMAIAMAKSENSFLVELDDFERAKRELIIVESRMPEIFKEMAVSADASEIDEAHQFLFNYCQDNKVDYCKESTLVHFLAGRVPVNKIGYFLETMLKSGIVINIGVELEGQRKLRPIALKRKW